MVSHFVWTSWKTTTTRLLADLLLVMINCYSSCWFFTNPFRKKHAHVKWDGWFLSEVPGVENKKVFEVHHLDIRLMEKNPAPLGCPKGMSFMDIIPLVRSTIHLMWWMLWLCLKTLTCIFGVLFNHILSLWSRSVLKKTVVYTPED